MTDNDDASGASYPPPGAPAGPPQSGPPPGGPAYPYGYPPGPGYGPYSGGYPPPPMPYAEGMYGAPAVMRNGLGVAALVLGLLGVFPGPFLCGIGIVLGALAIALGVSGRRRVGRGEADNGGVALAGIVLGVVAILVSAAAIAVGYNLLKNEVGDLIQCTTDAGGDQAKIDQCTTEFQQRMEERSQSRSPGR